MTHLLSFSCRGLFGDDPVLPAADSRCVANSFLSFARKAPAIGLASNSEAASSGSYARLCALMQAVQLVPDARVKRLSGIGLAACFAFAITKGVNCLNNILLFSFPHFV